MRRSRRIALFLLAAATMAPLVEAARPYRISAARKEAEEGWQPVGELEDSRMGVKLRIAYLEPDQRRSAIRSTLRRDLDLLPGRGDERNPGYLVFVLQIDNGSAEDVIFNPAQARLSSDKGDMKFAMDYSALYELVLPLGVGGPSLEEMATLLFDREVTISPGGSVRKLLAFEAPKEDRFRSFEVKVVEVNVGSKGVDFVFPFRKFTQ